MPPSRRLGLIVPQVNRAMEPELSAALPGTSWEVRRIPPRGRPGGTLLPEDMPAYGGAARALAATFETAPEIVAYGCTAGGFLAGAGAEARLLEAMREASGRPCMGTARAVADALVAARVGRVAVVTPYAALMNEALATYLGEFGVAVGSFTPLAIAAGAEAVRTATVAAASEACDGVFIACSLVPTIALLPELRAQLGLPVVSSIGATADAVAALLDAGGTPARAAA